MPNVPRVPGSYDSTKACLLGFPHAVLAGGRVPDMASTLPHFINVAKSMSVLLSWSVLTNYSHACRFSFFSCLCSFFR